MIRSRAGRRDSAPLNKARARCKMRTSAATQAHAGPVVSDSDAPFRDATRRKLICSALHAGTGQGLAPVSRSPGRRLVGRFARWTCVRPLQFALGSSDRGVRGDFHVEHLSGGCLC